MGAVLPYLADALVIFGTLVITLGVYGMLRLPDTYNRLHAASKAVVLGVVLLLVASVVTADLDIILRVVLIAFFLLITTPVSAHVIGLAAYQKGERMQASEPVDESGSGLDGR